MSLMHDPLQDSNVLPHSHRSIARLKTLIWSYFWLLILEGAVRKWIPPLANPFLVIRDPIALMIWIQGARLNVVDRRYWWAFYLFAFPITLLGLVQVIVLSVPIPVFAFGWRSYILHLPVIFVAASVLNFEDLRKFGKWILLVSLPMTVLMLLQYGASPDAWLNRGTTVGGEQLSSALGHIRPAGTFSFITGPTSFLPLVGAFVLLGLTTKDLYPRWLSITAGVALLVLTPFTGSRTIAFEIGALLIMAFIGAAVRGTMIFKPTQVPRIIAAIIITLVLVGITFNVPFVQDGILTFTTRWTSANESEGGAGTAIENRGLGGFANVFGNVADAPLLGTGIGSASNFASSYQRGYAGFTFGETAWEREVYELGSFTGMIFIGLRTFLTLYLLALAFGALRRGSTLSWYLLSGAAVNLLTGLLDQPTSQGFLIFITALIIAGLKNPVVQSPYGFEGYSHGISSAKV